MVKPQELESSSKVSGVRGMGKLAHLAACVGWQGGVAQPPWEGVRPTGSSFWPDHSHRRMLVAMPEGHTDRLDAALDGKYRIERKLGEGGMASVYLAEDLKHRRKVALKILRPELAAVIGGERFLSEITTTANLQHPHILPLFDSGEADGYLYYVMPYIDGETLREKLEREKQLGVDEAVRIASDVGDALDYAHRNDIIHRDIKPGNILLHDGRPVVADFGIALAVTAAGGGRLTETGLSLGTPHYMSPEQASADRDLSARSDVYSLGCVLYEMLAGQPPHTGPSAQSILVRILTDDPKPLTELRHTVPPNVAAAVTKSIEKLPADRFDTAAAFVGALRDETFGYAPAGRQTVPAAAATLPAAAPAVAGTPRGGAAALLPWSVAAVLAMVAAFGWLGGGEPAASPPATRLTLPLPPELAWDPGGVAISPDGSRFAIRTAEGVMIREAGQPGVRILPGTELPGLPTFSPAGDWVAYTKDGGLFKMAVTGSSPITLVPGSSALPLDPFWGEDGTIVFVAGGALWRVSDSGGDASQIGDEPIRGRFPTLLPDGSAVIFNSPQQDLQLVDRSTGAIAPLQSEALDGVYVPTGHILYGHPNGGLHALPFDVATHEVTGSQIPVLGEIETGINNAWYSVSRNGTLVFGSGGAQSVPHRLLLLGTDQTIDTVRLEPRVLQIVRFSPDGRRIAFNTETARNADRQVHTYDLVLETLNRLTFERGHQPIWSPDGSEIVYSSEREGTDAEDLWLHPADGSGAPRHLLSMTGDQHAQAWPSARSIVFESAADLFTVDPNAEEPAAVPYVRAEFAEREIAISPDETMAAYVSNETGVPEVFVRDFPDPRGKWQISNGGGVQPRWNGDGQSVYYIVPGEERIVRARLQREPSIAVLGTEEVWRLPGMTGWDLDRNTGRAIAIQTTGGAQASTSTLTVIVNWFEELRRLTGGGS